MASKMWMSLFYQGNCFGFGCRQNESKQLIKPHESSHLDAFNFKPLILWVLYPSAGRYTGSYRIPVFIFFTIWIFKIPQYRCHLNNVWNATLLERGLFSLLHFGEDTAVCVTMWSSETEALVECDEREEVIHNIHIDRHKYPPSAAISSRVSHKIKFSVDATDSCQLQGSRLLKFTFHNFKTVNTLTFLK